jgi:hypothetical protein
MADIVCYLKGNYVNFPEQVTLGVDQTELVTTITETNEIGFSIDLSPGAHVFWVRLHNRDETNRIYDPQGKNSKETFVEIDNLKIDNCMMNFLINDYGQTQIDWSKHPDVAVWFQEHQGHVPDVLHKSKYLGLAGCYEFRFEYPIQPWLRAHIKVHKDYEFMYNPPIEEFLNLKKLIG